MGSPQALKEWQASFVDGAGGKSVFPRMWQRMEPVVDGYIVVTLEETKRAMRIMADKARVIAEGAGALPLAAALTGKAGQGPIVAIVSGGNIDLQKFSELIGSVQGMSAEGARLAAAIRGARLTPNGQPMQIPLFATGAGPLADKGAICNRAVDMPYIQCPSCGHKALSVATRCPHCGVAFETGLFRHPESGSRPRRIPFGLVVRSCRSASTGGEYGAAEAERQFDRPSPSSGRRFGRTNSAPAAAGVSRGNHRQPSSSLTTSAPDRRVRPRPPSPEIAKSAPPTPAETPTAAEAPVDAEGAQRRYASTWMNVRANRSNTAPVLRILPPRRGGAGGPASAGLVSGSDGSAGGGGMWIGDSWKRLPPTGR